jgi:4-hydroxy-tetrahydrodipicolinate reductase
MTTGQNEEQTAMIKEASAKIPIFKSGNMSVGINIQSALVKKTAEILGETFDIEIVEAHHNKKEDAPSGNSDDARKIRERRAFRNTCIYV